MFENQVRELVTLQQSLMSSFRAQFPNASDMRLLLDFPIHGEIALSQQRWKFARHGLGLRFTRTFPMPAAVVDIHDRVDRPAHFDLWRLETYLNSLNTPCNSDELREQVAKLVDDQVVLQIDSHFELLK